MDPRIENAGQRCRCEGGQLGRYRRPLRWRWLAGRRRRGPGRSAIRISRNAPSGWCVRLDAKQGREHPAYMTGLVLRIVAVGRCYGGCHAFLRRARRPRGMFGAPHLDGSRPSASG